MHGEPQRSTQAAYEAGGVKQDGHQHAVDGLLASDAAFHWQSCEVWARELLRGLQVLAAKAGWFLALWAAGDASLTRDQILCIGLVISA